MSYNHRIEQIKYLNRKIDKALAQRKARRELSLIKQKREPMTLKEIKVACRLAYERRKAAGLE